MENNRDAPWNEYLMFHLFFKHIFRISFGIFAFLCCLYMSLKKDWMFIIVISVVKHLLLWI